MKDWEGVIRASSRASGAAATPIVVTFPLKRHFFIEQ